jgi:hypothetical protein
MTGQGQSMLCRIDHFEETLNNRPGVDRRISLCDAPEVSNSGQLLSDACAIIGLEMSTSSLSFRFSELSQLSEILSS